AWGNDAIACQACCNVSPCPFSMPSSLGACFTIMVSPRPNTNPLSTGSEINSDTKPRLKTLATSKRRPATIAVADPSATYLPISPAATGATNAASIAAEPEVHDTTKCLEEPNKAYTTKPAAAEYSPAWGGTPAMPAYAMPSGTSRPASAIPATTSARI